MPRRKYFRGSRCDVSNCKSERYYTLDGQTYCANNHLATGVLEFAIDEDEAMSGGFGARRRRGPEIRGSRRDGASRIVRGREGFMVFLEAYQCVMRHQARFLARKTGIEDVEARIKALWCTFITLQNVQERMPDPEPQDAEDEVDERMDQEGDGLGTDSGTESEVLPVTEFGSAAYSMHRPLLIHTIALSYLVLILLRVPVTIHHFKTWIDGEEFPYIRAIRFVPESLQVKLESQYHAALNPQLRPRASRIWRWTQQTAIFLRTNTNIIFPSLNYRPILYSIIKDTLLPLQIYNAVDTQLESLSMDLGVTKDQKNPMMSVPPECRVLALTLLLAKIFYSLDGVKRVPGTKYDAPINGPNLRAWHRAIKAISASLQGIDLVSKMEPKDIFSMNETSLDEYLDWYGQTWLSTSNQKTSAPEGILSMFPAQTVQLTTPLMTHGAIRQEQNRLDTITWLYSHAPEQAPKTALRLGEAYLRTSDEDKGDHPLFDDLIEVASLQYSITNLNLRKQIRYLERHIATEDSESSSLTKPRLGRPKGVKPKQRPKQTANVIRHQPYEESEESDQSYEASDPDEDSDADVDDF